MKKLITRKLFLLLVVLLGVVHASAQQQAPELSLKDIKGKTVKLSELKGKVVLLNFWATWCIPCREEIPDLMKKHREYESRGLRVIGITYPPEDAAKVRRFVREMKINYPVVITSEDTKKAFISWEGLPITVIIDREGKIRDIIKGIMYQDEFDEKVKPLLASDVENPE